MNWNVSWLFFGALAFLLALLNLGRAVRGKERGGAFLLFGSLACGSLTLAAEYHLAVNWVERGDYAALEDVLPGMERVLLVALFLGLVLNRAAAALYEGQKRGDDRDLRGGKSGAGGRWETADAEGRDRT